MDTNIGIYGFRNLSNGKWYVGSSKNLRKRQWSHLKNLKSGKHPNKHFQNAYNKDVFIFGVLEYCFQSDILDRENFWIDKLKSRNIDFGYNKMPALSGLQMTEELRKKMSESAKTRLKDGLTPSEWTKQWHAKRNEAGLKPQFSEEGKKAHSEALAKLWASKEHQEAMSVATQKRWEDPEYRLQRTGALKEQNASKEMKEKNRQGQHRRWTDPEKRKMVAQQSKLRWADPVYREKMRLAGLGKHLNRPPISNETRAKMKAARLAYLAK